jgi:hypothetical protein
MENLISLNEKRDVTVKARMCVTEVRKEPILPKKVCHAQTGTLEAIITTGVIDAKQRRDVMMLHIPNAFVQTRIPLNGDKIIMKICRTLVDILLELCPGVYDDYVRD